MDKSETLIDSNLQLLEKWQFLLDMYDHSVLHPIAEDVISEVQIGLGKEFQMDFLIREASGSYTLVEIENPQREIFLKNGEFTAWINHAQEQVEDWQDWIEDNIAAVQKKYPGMISPPAIVIIGRSVRFTERERRKLARRNINLRGRIQIKTYDDLIDEAKRYIDNLRAIQAS